jgi:Na+/melibiose symporter-like transporter
MGRAGLVAALLLILLFAWLGWKAFAYIGLAIAAVILGIFALLAYFAWSTRRRLRKTMARLDEVFEAARAEEARQRKLAQARAGAIDVEAVDTTDAGRDPAAGTPRQGR